MRKYGKIDLNQKEIVTFARQCGASVHSLASVGDGIPDLLVGFRGQTELWEIKGPKGKQTPDQVAFDAAWQGKPKKIIRSVEDAARELDVTL